MRKELASATGAGACGALLAANATSSYNANSIGQADSTHSSSSTAPYYTASSRMLSKSVGDISSSAGSSTSAAGGEAGAMQQQQHPSRFKRLADRVT
jgi:hypothetical protein